MQGGSVRPLFLPMNTPACIRYLSDARNRATITTLRAVDYTSINAVQKAIAAHPHAPVRDLLTLFRLQDASSHRFLDAHALMLTEKSAQQASSTLLAQYHASRITAGSTVADLCCGAGLDLREIAQHAREVYAVDLNADTLAMAEFNTPLHLRNKVTFLCQDASSFCQPVDAIFADPDRRSGQRRIIDPQFYSPSLDAILALQSITPNMLIKCAPATDYSAINIPLPYTWECVAEDDMVKEMLLCTGSFATAGIQRRAVLLPGNHSLTSFDAQLAVTSLKSYIIEPHGAVIRAGLVQQCGQQMQASLLHKRIALLTADSPVPSPFGTMYQVIDHFNYSLKRLKQWLNEHNIGQLTIKTRGFPETVEQFRKRLKLQGTDQATLFLIRMDSGFLAVITSDPVVPEKKPCTIVPDCSI